LAAIDTARTSGRDERYNARMRKALPVIWLVAYSILPAPVMLFALIFAFEGLASLRRYPENALLTAAAILFVIAWPLSALGSWVLLALGRVRGAWLLSVGAAVLLVLLWASGLGVAAVCGRR
jgi:hypothetical protein